MKPILKLFLLFLFNAFIFARADSSAKELRVVLQPALISLDPGGIQDSQSWMVSRQVNCQLFRSQGSTFVLDAAESIKYLSQLKIILKISDKAKFHDSTVVTAADILASLNYIKESRKILGNLFNWVEKIEIIDDKTILFSLKKQIPQFLKVLSSTNYTIFKKSFLAAARKDKNLWKKPMGCGGYKVEVFSNDYIKLIPLSQGLPIGFYVSKTSQIDASELEKYDIVTVNVMGQSKEIENFNVIDMFDPTHYFVGLNSKSKMWKNKYDRCKFLAELDSKNLLDGYGKSAIEANYFLPKGILGYSANENFNDQIISFSNKAENQESDSRLKPFCLSYLSVSVQEKHKSEYLNMFKKQYPNVFMKEIVNVKKFGKDFVDDNCDALLFAWKTNYLDGYEYLTIFEDNNANFSGINDKSLSGRILKSQDISNVENRVKEYQKIIKEIGNLCIIRPLFTIPTRRFYIRKSLKTPGIGLISIHQYYFGRVSR